MFQEMQPCENRIITTRCGVYKTDTMPPKYMDMKTKNNCVINAQYIQLSEETKALLICRAKLSEIYNEVAEIYDKKYRRDIDDDFCHFAYAHSKFDDELMKIISTFIAVNSGESDYTKM